jgi:hypothetical protein
LGGLKLINRRHPRRQARHSLEIVAARFFAIANFLGEPLLSTSRNHNLPDIC